MYITLCVCVVVEALKKAMEDIEFSIAAFKNHQRAL